MQVVPGESDVQEQEHQNGSHIFDNPVSGVHIRMWYFFLELVAPASPPSLIVLLLSFRYAKSSIEPVTSVAYPLSK